MAKRVHGWRRVGRWLFRGTLAVLGLVIALVGAAIIAIHTPWGRDYVRRELVSTLGKSFRGKVSIGSLEGSPFTTLVARDVEIDDASGRKAIVLDRVGLHVGLLGLLHKDLHITELDIDGAAVLVRQDADGSINLATLIAPDPPGETGPRSWAVTIDRAFVHGGSVDVDAGGRIAHVDDLAIEAAAALPIDGAVSAKLELGGRWREGGVPVSLAAALGKDGDQLSVSRARAAIGEVALFARDVHARGRRVSGTILAVATPRGVRVLAPGAPLVGAVAIGATIAPIDGLEDGRATIALSGLAGGARIFGGVMIDPPNRRVKGAIEVRGADGARIVRGAPASAVDLLAVVDLALRPSASGVDAVDGTAQVIAGGRAFGARVTTMHVGVAADHGAIVASVRAAAPGATAIALDTRFAIRGAATGAPALDVTSATLTARSRRIDRLAPGRIPARGRISVDVSATGTLARGATVATVEGRVLGDDIEAAGYSAHRLTIDLDGAGLPARPSGRVHVELDGVAHAGRAMLSQLTADARTRADRRIDLRTHTEPATGPWKADVDAIADVTRDRVAIELGDHRVRTHGLDWTGRGGTVTIDRRAIAVRGVSTNLAGGHIAVDGTFTRAGAHAGDADAKVAVEHLDLAVLAKALGSDGVLKGTADGTVAIARTDDLVHGTIDGAARGLVTTRDATPIDVAIGAKLEPKDVEINATLAGGVLGKASLALAIDAPRRLDDPVAWRRLDRDDVRKAELVVENVNAPRLAAAAGVTGVKAGRIDGALHFDAGKASGTLTVRGLTQASMPAPLDADLSISNDGTDATGRTGYAIELKGDLRGLAVADARARTALPDNPFDPAAWRTLDARAFHGAHLHIDGDLQDQEASRQLGLITPWRGRGALDLDVAPAFASLGGRIRVTRFTGGTIVEPVDADLQIAVDEHGLAARLISVFEKRPLVSAQLNSTVTPAQLVLALRQPEAMRNLALNATLDADRIQIESVLRATGRGGDPTGGEASISAQITGTLGDPHAEIFASLADLSAGHAVVSALRATATYQGGAFTMKVDGDEQQGGTLALTATADVAHLDQASAKLEAKRFDLAPLARLAPPSIGIGGVLDADLDLTGYGPAGKVGGTMHLSDGELPIYPLIGTLRRGDVTVKIDGDTFDLVAKGEVGRGTLSLHGKGQMSGLLPATGTADATIHQITLINESQPTLDGTAHLELSKADDVLHVKIGLENVMATLPDDKGATLHPVSSPADIVVIRAHGRKAPTQTTVVLGRRPWKPYLIATIDLGNVRVESTLMRGTVTGTLTATVGTDAVSIDGLIQTGIADVTISDRRYRVDHATVRFDGGVDPMLDILLTYDFSSMTLYAAVHGRMSAPKLRLSSDPSTYSQAELLGFLVGGAPGQAPADGIAEAASGIASGFLASKVKGGIKRYTGVAFDVLKLEAATSSSSAAVTVGKWVSTKLFVSYRQRVDGRYDQNSSEAEGEYWLGHRVVIDGSAGDRGVDELDLVWTRRW